VDKGLRKIAFAGHTLLIDIVFDALNAWCPWMTPLTNFLFKFDLNRFRQIGKSIPYDRLKGIVMPTGTVKFFDSAKGFGFIAPEGASQDVFVHISAVERAGLHSLTEGQKVSFEVVKDRRSGKNAADNLQAL